MSGVRKLLNVKFFPVTLMTSLSVMSACLYVLHFDLKYLKIRWVTRPSRPPENESYRLTHNEPTMMGCLFALDNAIIIHNIWGNQQRYHALLTLHPHEDEL